VSSLLLALAVLGPISGYADTIFFDDFARPASNSLGNGWSEDGNDNNDVAITVISTTGNGVLKLRDHQRSACDACASQLLLETLGYENIQLAYDWRLINTSSEAIDFLYAEWKRSDATTWILLTSHSLGGSSTDFTVVNSPLGPSASNTSGPLQVRFRTNVDSSGEGVYIDNVRLTGDPILVQNSSAPTPLPEPASLLFLGMGLVGIAGLRFLRTR
jgi:hypothetical protein